MKKKPKGKRNVRGSAAARAAAKLARATSRVARLVAAAEREDDRRALRLARQAAHAQAGSLATDEPAPAAGAAPDQAVTPAATPAAVAVPRDRALLIINTKSGPNHDSILYVRQLVGLFATHGIRMDVRVKLRKKQAARDARRAARAGYPLVVAAGGDGTVEAVARGLAGTKTVLGVLPLGTYNNVATCLGIPADPVQACALIATGATRPVDVGWVKARGGKPRIFLEMAAIGVTAALMPAGQSAKKGAWGEAMKRLPAAAQMTPCAARIRLDGVKPDRRATTLLVEVANGPRMGPGLVVNPEARMDDGLLDVAVYDGVQQAALAARFVALKAGAVPADNQVERACAQRVYVRTATPLPVIADSKVVGTTPARFGVRPGALLVVAGHGDALSHPVAAALVDATAGEAHPTILPEPAAAEVAAQAEAAAAATAAGAPAPLPRPNDHKGRAAAPGRSVVLPAIAATAGAALLPALRLLRRRR